MFSSDLETPPTAGLPLAFGCLLPPWKNDFAADMAGFLGVSSVGIECSGTASLVLILETLRRMSDRRVVIVPAFTCPLVVFAVLRCGLQLRLCDVRPGSFEFDLQDLARQCDRDTLAVVPTHLGGRVCQLADVIEISRQCGAYVIEDAAQALGARWQGRSVGHSGDAAFFSLAAGKGLSIFEGGVWFSDNAELMTRIMQVREQLIPRQIGIEAWRCLQLLGYTLAYGPRGLRHAYGNPLRRALRRNDLVEAAGDYFHPEVPVHQVSAWRQAVGSKGLARLPEFQQRLARQAADRLPVLRAIDGVRVLTDPVGAEGTWPIFMLLLPSQPIRDRVMADLWGAGLGVARMFVHALPDYPYLRPWVTPHDVPNARAFAACSMTVSNSPWLNDARFARVVEVLARHLR